MTEDQISNLGRLLVFASRAGYVASLYGSCEEGQKLYRYMKSPNPGDWVIESSTIGGFRTKEHGGPVRNWMSAIGRLIVRRDEFFPYENADGGFHDTVWHIESIDGRHIEWRNCDFHALPFDLIDTCLGGPKTIFSPPNDENEQWVSEATKRHGIMQDPEYRIKAKEASS